MTNPYRILVTGSRDWDDVETIWQAMGEAVHNAGQDREIVVVHGACPRGADWHADRWARLADAQIERHPADWARHGNAAGFRRNAEMVNLGADVALAFIRNGSRGASHTARLAEAAGIPHEAVDRVTAPPIDWHDVDTDTEPGDHQPTPFDCRQHEMRDLRGQHAGPHALWTAHTIPTQEYL